MFPNASSMRSSKGLGSQVLSFSLNNGMRIGLVKLDFFGFLMVLVRQLVEGCSAESEDEECFFPQGEQQEEEEEDDVIFVFVQGQLIA